MSPTRSSGPGGWRPREVAAAITFLAVVAFQFALPAQRLVAVAAGEPPPARFGWQMYSRTPERLAMVALFDDGSERAVYPSALLARPRAEILVAELVPTVCAASPRVRAVAVIRAGERHEIACPARTRPDGPGATPGGGTRAPPHEGSRGEPPGPPPQ